LAPGCAAADGQLKEAAANDFTRRHGDGHGCYCGRGVQMATYLGQCMAEVMDGHPEANPWRDLPFPKPPLVYKAPWYLPVAGAYFKVKDRLT
jgi:hypothetical protein